MRHPELHIPQSRIEFARSRGLWADTTIDEYFQRNARLHPDRIAVVDYNSTSGKRTSLTYSALAGIVDALASGLAGLGVGHADVISSQLPNWWQAMALHLAAVRIGAVSNPVMPIFRERELRFMLGHVRSKVLVVPDRFRNFDHAGMVAGLRADLPDLQHVLIIGGDGTGSFDRMISDPRRDVHLPHLGLAPDDLVQVAYTSGTSGEPKGVMHTSNTLLANLLQNIRLHGLDEHDVTLISSPIGHQTGFIYGILAPIVLGGTVVYQDVWSAEAAVDIIARERVTYSIGAPTFLSDIVEAARSRKADVESLRLFVVGGAPIPRALVVQAKEVLGTDIASMWGMTENGPAAYTRLGDSHETIAGTDGLAGPAMEMRVVDEVGSVLPAGAEGRLLVRGAGNFLGYWKRPQWNATDADDWFDTGDVATMDERGYLRITGRTKDVIVRGGEKIPVVEIENLLYQHPAVADVAIVGMPDVRLTERACAFVVPRPGATLTLPDVVTFLIERGCTRQHIPERLEVVTGLPRTPSGKVQKFQLRETARAFADGS